MNYTDFFDLNINIERNDEIFDNNRPIIKNKVPESDYDFVRYGEPSGMISFVDTKDDRKKLLKHYMIHGYKSWPRKIDSNLRKHVAFFRACLDLWENFSPKRVFTKDEIYYRSLKEGPAFTEYIKKCRATCLRGKTSETDTDIEEEYFHEEYSGYNSIIHERYLIHWDDTDSIDDIKYAFMPTKKVNEGRFRKMVKNLFEDFRIRECEFQEEIDMIGEMKATKMFDPKTGKTHLMREFWREGLQTDSPYYAKRTIVPTDPGTTRDTGVGDPSTILKVKILNSLSRAISTRLPYSANSTENDANSRLLRVLKRNCFLHLDFKKFGLTFPRVLTNILIEEMSIVSGIDTSDLKIDTFTVEIDGEAYLTERGTMLGWLDAVNSICVCAILHSLICDGLQFDFITFNDDVEISARGTNPKVTLELLRSAVIGTLAYFDIPISLSKTYGSKASVFLERYAYFTEGYQLDMYKEQLTVKAYAVSLITEYPWKAKMFFAAAEQWTKSEYAVDRCISTCAIEFSHDEWCAPLWSGGWYIHMENKCDRALLESSPAQISLGVQLQKWKRELYSTDSEKTSSEREIRERVNKMTFYANTAEDGRNTFGMEEVLDDINVESDTLLGHVMNYVQEYTGWDKSFPEKVIRILERYEGPRDWGP